MYDELLKQLEGSAREYFVEHAISAIRALSAENVKLQRQIDAMKPRRLIEVIADDWAGLYVDGKLFTEGYSISVDDLVRASNGKPYVSEPKFIKQSWMEVQDTFPNDFTSIPSSAWKKEK